MIKQFQAAISAYILWEHKIKIPSYLKGSFSFVGKQSWDFQREAIRARRETQTGTEAKHRVSKDTLSNYRFVKCLSHVIAIISYCYKKTNHSF